MAKIITFTSFFRGTGKSGLIANMAALLAMKGLRVGLVDTDISAPGLNVRFLPEVNVQPLYTLNNYLNRDCTIEQATVDVTARLGSPIAGKLFFTPSSMKAEEIARALRNGYDVSLLEDGFQRLVAGQSLDVLLIDTQAGINEANLTAIAMSDKLAILLRLDQQDYQGASVVLDLARRLEVPETMLIVNLAPADYSLADVRARVEKTYATQTTAALPACAEMLATPPSEIFVLKYPQHPFTALLRELSARWVDG